MMGMLPEAIREVGVLGREGSLWMETHMVTAAIKFDRGDWNDLLPLSRRLREVFPAMARWILYEAEALHHVEDVWSATACVMRALPRFPREPEFRYLLHYLHGDAGNLDNARYWLGEALRLDARPTKVAQVQCKCHRIEVDSVFALPKKVPRGEKS